MKAILLPTDFSKNSLQSIDFAVKKLKSDSTKLIILNVFQIPQGGQSGLFYLQEEMQKQADRDMNDLKQKLVSLYGESAKDWVYKISQGDLSDQTNAIANDYDVDCIVTGTKGASGLKEVLIGSNTVSLINNLKRPLYAVPSDYDYNQIEEVIFPFDGKEFAQDVADKVSLFAKKHNLPIDIVHVRTKDEDIIKDWTPVKSRFDGLDVDCIDAYAEKFEDGLNKAINEKKGIIAMIRHKQSFWERLFNRSDSRKILMHAQLPILVVPE